jgi:mannose-6-phosphate isomerase
MGLFTFQPQYKERIWGGQRLAEMYDRTLPPEKKIGESWELVDRPEACSVLTEPVDGMKDLHDLWTARRRPIFGRRAPETERFPILLKLLDCRENLSVQVHPPARVAAQLKGEPKTELWYFLQGEEGAQVYVGLKKGVTRKRWEEALGGPRLAEWLHVLKPRPYDSLFLPSGRVHAIGAGNLIFEVQQNSDTTYRVDDWGRLDAAGQPRELHIKESLESIQFGDIEPQFTQPHGEKVVECSCFCVYQQGLFADEFRTWHSNGETCQYHFIVQGRVSIGERSFKKGEGVLVSADHGSYDLTPGEEGADVVTVQLGIN